MLYAKPTQPEDKQYAQHATPMAKKLQLGYREIEERLQAFHDGRIPASEVGERLLFSFGKSERDIARYREGKGILKTFTDGLLIKGLFCFQPATTLRLSSALERLKADPLKEPTYPVRTNVFMS